MASAPPDRLYALRLTSGAEARGLQGEVEHVVSGARCRFGAASELVAWLQARHEPAPTAAPGPVDAAAEPACAQAVAAAAPASVPPPQDATT